MEIESNLVIKVKYGDTLRRFTARVDDAEQRLGLDMAGLRAKIWGLFDFPVGTEFTLTYIDEDGDVVALVDDEDLYDVMRQRLKFLRINVQLDGDKLGKPYGASGRSSTLRSPSFQLPSEGLNAGAADVVKSVPEPLRRALSDAFSKLSLDAALKAASAKPVLNDFVECLSKMGQTYLSPVSKPGTASDSSIPVESSGSPCTTSVAADSDGGLRAVLPKPTDVDSICKDSKEGNTGNATRGVDVPAISDPLSNANVTGCATVSSPQSPSNIFPCNDQKNTKESMVRKKGKSVSFDTSAPFFDATKKYDPINMMGRDPSNECPFGGMPVASDLVVPPPFSQSKRMFVSTDENGTQGTFHKGIQCDGCGVLPITGPRFKSKVKDDYDLCSICFSKMGNEADYIRMDRPVHSSNPWLSRELPHVSKNRVAEPMLASCFVSDVNILDGTVMVPSAPFTKIWRMRNNGTTPWFRGFQLIWIGGDKLRDSTTVDLEIPADGVPVDGELDIAVDFTAPPVPGQYVSYWRMASEAGIKFGQYVWVLIHVDDSLKNTSGDDFQGLNLNLPPENTCPRDTEICNSNADTAPVGPLINEQSTTEQTLNNRDVLTPVLSPTISSSVAYPFIPKGFPVPTSPKTPSSSFYPVIDLSEAAATARAMATQEPPPLTPTEENSENAIEQTLLKELEDMGFKQVNLNKEILRMNEYNLEKSIDDLCGASEWDPMLEELQEMGFCDVEMNKMLLKKHNGSIRGAVVDLLSEETA
ncbi:Arabidopsis thaliana next to BRCA1 gene 1, next to BRCA1 gene 1 [Hibiscus trionum]|uniref:Arabidopsis thaliana next to BRCA1 gene 1, next to BRCA1 gene 1 n=1 Tax=Hibiscus trionum TaxID=183268 RepID=A0A9W7GYE9_HIBTR|nr:Arabidopsis thaliana next to BRCA1 gene 1, next to BRCA1 gene 1 [Hibiscus trionum]